MRKIQRGMLKAAGFVKKNAGKIAAVGVGVAAASTGVHADLDGTTTNIITDVSTVFGYIKPVTMGIVGFGIIVSLVKLLKRK